jgi:hypothetical protein
MIVIVQDAGGRKQASGDGTGRAGTERVWRVSRSSSPGCKTAAMSLGFRRAFDVWLDSSAWVELAAPQSGRLVMGCQERRPHLYIAASEPRGESFRLRSPNSTVGVKKDVLADHTMLLLVELRPNVILSSPS